MLHQCIYNNHMACWRAKRSVLYTARGAKAVQKNPGRDCLVTQQLSMTMPGDSSYVARWSFELRADPISFQANINTRYGYRYRRWYRSVWRHMMFCDVDVCSLSKPDDLGKASRIELLMMIHLATGVLAAGNDVNIDMLFVTTIWIHVLPRKHLSSGRDEVFAFFFYKINIITTSALWVITQLGKQQTHSLMGRGWYPILNP